MNRREFIQESTAKGIGLMALPLFVAGKTEMGVVVHSYWSRWQSKATSQRYPAFTNALELFEHCHSIGAGGVQTGVNDWTPEFAGKVKVLREKYGMYLEGSISIPKNADDVARFDTEIMNAKAAGASVFRTVTSAGRRYEAYHSTAEVQGFMQAAMNSLRLAEPVLKKHKVKLGIENHKDWRANEFVDALKKLQSEWIGVTIDFGNSMALLEDPTAVVDALAPYVVATHVKDMAVEEYPDGFLLSEVPLGQGLLDLPAMVAKCRKYNPAVTLNLEMITRDPLEIPCLTNGYWNAMEGIPATDLARALKLAKPGDRYGRLPRVTGLSEDEKLALEEKNIVACLQFSKTNLD